MRISDWSSDVCSSDLGALGEDAAAETGEDRDQRGAKAERHERINHDARGGLITKHGGEDEEVNRNAEKREAGNERSEERRVGKESVSTCRSRCAPDH